MSFSAIAPVLPDLSDLCFAAQGRIYLSIHELEHFKAGGKPRRRSESLRSRGQGGKDESCERFFLP